MKHGIVTDNAAFNYFIKLVHKLLVKYYCVDNQIYSAPGLLNIHLVILTSSNVLDLFSKTDLQTSYNYFYENIDQLSTVTILSSALSLVFAHGGNNVSTALVVDVGYEKVAITPVIDYLPATFASITLPEGSTLVNSLLAKLLPTFSESQVEDLKRSAIYEVLAAKKASDDDEIDVIKAISKPKENEKITKNAELETNTFVDSSGSEIEIGKERFKGTEELIERIVFYTDYVISRYPDKAKRQELWSHIIVNGPTTGIRGFRERLLESLQKNYLAATENETIDPESRFRATTETEQAAVFSQAPTDISFLEKAVYFQDWKDHTDQNGINSELAILGAAIYVRLCFGPGSHHAVINNIGNELYMIRRDDFEEHGPDLIWDLGH